MKHERPKRRSPLYYYHLGREAVRRQGVEEDRHAIALNHLLKDCPWDWHDKPYFKGELPVINAREPSPLAELFLDEVAAGNIRFDDLNNGQLIIPNSRPWSRDVRPLWIVDHVRRGDYGSMAFGEFNDWYLYKAETPTPVFVLVQPSQVNVLPPPFANS